MNETNSLAESVIENEESAIFCRKCGNKLVADMNVCDQCGTEVVKQESDAQEDEIPFNNEEYEASKLSLKKKKRKKLLIIFVAILSLAVLTVAGFFVSKLIVKPQDINTINGCPEFYNLDWEMSQYDVDEAIKLKHTFIAAFPKLDSSSFEVSYDNDASLYIDEEEVFYLYGKKTEYVYIGFDENRLEAILFTFSKDKYSLNNIATLYKRIYGVATETNSTSSTWIGKKTTIDVFDYTSDDGESEIVVRYSITPNSQYENLSFDGLELDPCSFLSENYAFNKKPEYYTDGLEEDEDYDKEVYSPEGFSGFTQYVLYPSFEFMGIDKGYTAIEFNVGEDKDTIETASYKFLLSKDNVVDRMTYIYSKLSEKYGKEDSSTYTSTYYDKMGIKDVNFNEMKNRFAKGTEGMYHIQWKSDGRNITLSLTISVDKEYYEGSVGYTD